MAEVQETVESRFIGAETLKVRDPYLDVHSVTRLLVTTDSAITLYVSISHILPKFVAIKSSVGNSVEGIDAVSAAENLLGIEDKSYFSVNYLFKTLLAFKGGTNCIVCLLPIDITKSNTSVTKISILEVFHCDS